MKKKIGQRYYPSASAIDVDKLKAARFKLGLKQDGLAAKAGVSLFAVRKAEQGKNIRTILARSIAEALNGQFDTFFVTHSEIGYEPAESLNPLTPIRRESGPSASEFVIRRIERLLSRLRQRNRWNDALVKDLITKSLTGRDQLLRPLGAFFQTVAEGSSGPAVAVRKAAELFLKYCHRAHANIVRHVGHILQNNERRMPDTIVLADFSGLVASSLSELANRNARCKNEVNILLVVGGKERFPSQEDTRRWEGELKKPHFRRFYRIEKRVPFDELPSEFKRIKSQNGRVVVLMGIERAYPEGQFLDWSPMSAIVNGAAIYSFEVIVAAECYKVQPRLPEEFSSFGVSMEGALTPLMPFQVGPGVHFVTDHAAHSVQSDAAQSGMSFKCCYRFWLNQMARKRYPVGIIFDLDGTIIDSEHTHKKLYQNMAAALLGYDLTDTQYFSSLCGLTDEETFRRILALAARKGDPEKLAIKKQEEFLRYLTDGKLGEVPGVGGYIRRLAKEGYLIGLATSATKQEATLALEKCGLTNAFDAVITSEEVDIGKPEPHIYRKAVQALGLDPSECLVYEDSINGIIAAHKAGIRVVAVGNAADGAVRRAGAMMRIPDFRNHALPVVKTP
jgi:HAD superfamily hydrolase (TIGR01509 family)